MLSRYIPCRAWTLSVVILGLACPTACGQQAAPDAAAKVPLKRIVLFNSGVGYFEHLGPVTGNTTVDLKFRVDDVNDLLKSMVLEDLGGGQISTVTYGSRDPVTKTLKTFAIDLTTNPTLGQLLAQIRGEKVEVNAPTAIQGTIVGIETQRQVRPTPGGDQIIEIELLNLLTDEGLRRIPLDSVGRIKLANAELDAEFRQALTVLATAHATDKKTVTLNFLGQGDRNVRVGYIQESPVWKTSYRLVLADDEKPFLQGWAIVENTSDEDWQDVNLSLVSGRPISFVMDLYSPLYATRPLERMELYAGLRPQVYGQDLARAKQEFAAAGEPMNRGEALALGRAAGGVQQSDAARGGQGGRGGAVGLRDSSIVELYSTMDIAGAVRSVAQAGDIGELFQYNIKDPVTLARQRSAMLPIINGPIDGEKLSIYNARVHQKHPLNGVRLKNTSDLHLMQGPMTVFDGGVYAGDSKIPDLPPGSERLLSYALDLDVEVAPTTTGKPRQMISAQIVKGVLQVTYKLERSQKYVVKNSGRQAKTVLIEYPIDASWKLLVPEEPTEKTRDMYRFAVQAEPGKPADLAIELERTQRQNVAITKLNDGGILVYLNAEVVSQSVKDALREVMRRKAALAELNRRKQEIDQEVNTIVQDQDRTRQNMRAIAQNTDLYNRYVTNLNNQEDQLERLRAQSNDLRDQIAQAQKALDDYLMGLELT